jgi:hypothetical protein
MGEIFTNIIGGIQYDIFRHLVAPIVMTIAATTIVRQAFGVIQQRRQALTFAVSFFVICMTLFYFIGSTSQPQRAELKAIINYMSIGDQQPPSAIAIVTIINAGTTQSVVLGVSLKTIIDGRTYIGVPITMPEKLSLNIENNTVTYYGIDSLIPKLSVPIVPGGEVNGVCAFIFTDAPSGLFNRPAKYILSYSDVFGRIYEASAETTSAAHLPTIQLPGVRQDINPVQSSSTAPTPVPAPTPQPAPEPMPAPKSKRPLSKK